MSTKNKSIKRRNPVARVVRSPAFRIRRVKPLKGKGSYIRRLKHRGGGFNSGRGQFPTSPSTADNSRSAVSSAFRSPEAVNCSTRS